MTEAWLATDRAKIAHCYNPLDSRIPMRAFCGHREWPQRLGPASSLGYPGPVYCPKCLPGPRKRGEKRS